jgi:hypothetical protein
MEPSWMYEVTPTQVKRFENDCCYFADEPVTAELVRNTLYAYGSELACRRIRDTYRHTDMSLVSFGYSENLKTWFFGLTIKGL